VSGDTASPDTRLVHSFPTPDGATLGDKVHDLPPTTKRRHVSMAGVRRVVAAWLVDNTVDTFDEGGAMDDLLTLLGDA
jgi:hypothetical protein